MIHDYDTDLMRNLRKTPFIHTTLTISVGLGTVMFVVAMFVESLIRNS